MVTDHVLRCFYEKSSGADIKKVLNNIMLSGKSYLICKNTYLLLSEFYRYLEREDLIEKNPMRNVEIINRMREEVYLGEVSPLIPNEKGNFIKPINLLSIADSGKDSRG